MASATTSEFVRTTERPSAPPFSLIEQKGLIARLGEELARSAHELSRDPRGFVRDIFSAENRDAKRRRRLYLGLACGVVAHTVLIAVIVVAGWQQISNVEKDAPKDKITWIDPNDFKPPAGGASESAKPDTGRGTDGGGGGGGQQSLRAASKGVLPRSAPIPPIVAPTALSIPSPLLPVPATIAGPLSTPPLPDAPVGDPNGKPGEPSAGTGSGGGIGSGNGPGVGSGKGPGSGPGNGGGSGGGTNGPGSGSGSGGNSFNFGLPKPPGFTQFSWTYRPTPIVTPEAQENKVIGTVLLRATFRADGTITDIDVINPVPFMTESAIEALKRSKFRPANYNGVPVTVYNVPVRINVHY